MRVKQDQEDTVKKAEMDQLKEECMHNQQQISELVDQLDINSQLVKSSYLVDQEKNVLQDQLNKMT